MKAYIIGNVTIDETLDVAAMPQLGDSILGRVKTTSLGGKGANQAIIMARAGLDVHFMAAIGCDMRAKLIEERLKREPVDAQLIVMPDKQSDFSIIFTTPDGENAIVTTNECAGSLTPEAAITALDKAQANDLVVLQGNLGETTTRCILEKARAHHLVTIVNPSPVRPYFANLWPLIDIVFLNQSEAQSLTGSSDEQAFDHLRQHGLRHIVLTLGSKGAIVARQHQEPHFVGAHATKVIDTTGAGDTFMAVALASMARRGVTIDARALEHAARASALTISRSGTNQAFPTIEELRTILKD